MDNTIKKSSVAPVTTTQPASTSNNTSPAATTSNANLVSKPKEAAIPYNPATDNSVSKLFDFPGC